MALSQEEKPERKVIWSLEDAFQDTEKAGGEEWNKLWHFYRKETKEEAILRRVKRDTAEHQAKYLACSQSVLFSLCLHLGIGNKEVYKTGNYICAGMGGVGTGRSGGVAMCGALISARIAIGLALGRGDMYEPGPPSGPAEPGQTSIFMAGWPFSFEITEKVEKYYGSTTCSDIMEGYFGKTWFKPSDYKDPKQWKMHEDNSMYQLVSTYAAKVCEWTAGATAEIILRERKNRGIDTPMPLR